MSDYLIGLTPEQIDDVALVLAASRIDNETVRSALDQLRLVVMVADYDALKRARDRIAAWKARDIEQMKRETRRQNEMLGIANWHMGDPSGDSRFFVGR